MKTLHCSHTDSGWTVGVENERHISWYRLLNHSVSGIRDDCSRNYTVAVSRPRKVSRPFFRRHNEGGDLLWFPRWVHPPSSSFSSPSNFLSSRVQSLNPSTAAGSDVLSQWRVCPCSRPDTTAASMAWRSCRPLKVYPTVSRRIRVDAFYSTPYPRQLPWLRLGFPMARVSWR